MTGGAGFIGSNFVHHVVEHTDADGDGARQADLRRAAASRSTACPQDRVELVVGDIADAAAGRPAGRRARRGRPLRGRVAQRQLARRPRRRSSRPTSSAPSRCSRRSAGTTSGCTTSPPTRCTATSSSTTRSGSPRTRRTTRRSPYSATKAGSDHLVRAWVRSFGVRATISQLLQQLRPLAAHREVHPAPDHQRHRRRAGPSSTAPGSTSATGSTPTTTPRRCWPILEQRPDRRDLPDRRRRRAQQPRGRADDPRALRPRRGRLRARHRPRRPRPALRDRLRPSCATELGWQPRVPGLRGRPRRHHRLVPRARGLVAPAQAGRPRRATPAKGQ